MRKRFLLLFLCLCLIGVFTTACGGGGKTTPPDNSAFYYLLAQQNANNEQQPDPSPTPDPRPTPDPSPTEPTPTPSPTEPTPTPSPTLNPEAEKYPLQLSQTEFTLNVGATDNITVRLNGDDITETATYTVDQEAIVRVEQGVITGLSVGIATVTVHSDNAEADKTFTVNVLPNLEVSKSSLSLIVGTSEDITVTIEGKPVTEGLKYEVKDPEVAKVKNCKVTALAKGSTTVTVSLENGASNSAVFTVKTLGKGDSFKFGRYRQTGEGDNPEEWNPNAETWEPQPIEWQILDIDTENNRALLLSLYGLDTKEFGSNYYWISSEICSWLNSDNEGGFYNTAFNETEKSKINATTLSDVDTTGTYKVFLLSYDEATNTKYFADAGARQCLATAYAKKHNANVDDNGYCSWWLRSSIKLIIVTVYCVLPEGSITWSVNSNLVVRPALWINL